MPRAHSRSTRLPRLILGSSSPRRRELMTRLGMSFEIITPRFHEQHQDHETPRVYTARNAREKARHAAVMLPSRAHTKGRYIVIGCDTIVVLGDAILEKPRDKAEARRMLRRLSGRSHDVFSGLTLLEVESSRHGVIPIREKTKIVRTRVTFKKLSDTEIRSYVDSGEPMDKAGAYGAQGIGAYIIKEIVGSYSNVVGLPLTELCEILMRDFDYPVWRGFDAQNP